MMMTKKPIFLITTLALPFIVLFLLELAFRLLGLFAQEPLFLEVSRNGQAHYQVNDQVANRYFNAREMAVPKLFPDTFRRVKPQHTLRIFCLGGSTTAGFPFEAQVPFPFQMKKILEKADAKNAFEVINLGLSAVNSFTVLDFIPEILQMQPDMLVIYMGHNEFYGAYGSASTISVGSSGKLIRLYLKLQKWHLVQALKRLITGLQGDSPLLSGDQTLMEKVIGDQSISCNSEKYHQTLTNFEDNLNMILRQASDASVPVFVGNLVSNVRNMQPMESLQHVHPAIETLSEIMLIRLREDSTDAMLYFQAGKYLLSKGLSEEAAGYCFRAKDLDGLRFRASEDVNDIIRKTCRLKDVHFVDIKAKITEQSEYHIPGDDLFCDHLHPNPVGYRLMAEGFAREILDSRGVPLPSDSVGQVHITKLDWDIGLVRIFKLLHRWPFAVKAVDFSEYNSYGDALTADIAHRYVYENHNWPQSHYDLAAMYEKQGRTADARAQYLAVSDFYPDRASPLKKIAETYLQEKKWQKAIDYLLAALKLSEQKGMLYFELAKAQWNMHRVVPAVESIQKAIVAPEMTGKQKAVAAYYFAGFLVEGRRDPDAIRVLQDALRFDPELEEAKQLLKRLQN